MTSLRNSSPNLTAYTTPEHALSGRYVIERVLGVGGMATVFLGRDLKHDRHVAVKVLRPELTSSVNTERFQREITLAAGLTHPHILPVHDSGSVDNLLYYVMPYVEGETLGERIEREGQLSMTSALRITRAVAGALQFAHERGIVHRDIKPANVLLAAGVPVVADFGLARALERDSGSVRLTEAGLGVGTPVYMSPEQGLGSRDVDARADQYSLACVVFEMLTGRPPFDGASYQRLLAQHLTEPPPSVSTSRPDLPPYAANAIARALSKDPKDRYGTVQEFAHALEGGDTSEHPSRGVPSTPRRAMSKRRRYAVFGAIAIAAAATAIIVRGTQTSASPARLNANQLVVAPFDVFSPALSVWREGLMDILSRSLDGAGPLRTVSPTLVVRGWKGRADRESALELARSTRSGLAVFGQLIAYGADSVRASITIADATHDSTLSPIEVREATSRMDLLGDSIAVKVLREIGRIRSITSGPRTSLGSRSLPAIKAFLAGEQLYRRNKFVEARPLYEQAIGLDSGFALAYHQLVSVLKWTENETLGREYGYRAGALNHGLSERDSLLVLADSLDLPVTDAFKFIEPAALIPNRRRLVVLGQVARLYPDDPEVWTALGKFYIRASRSWADPDRAIAAFERALQVDSLFGPAYTTAIELALAYRGLDSTLVLTNRYLRINPSDTGVVALVEFLRGDRSDAKVKQIVDGSPGLHFVLRRWPDPDETGSRLFRLLMARRPDMVGLIGGALRFRGHMQEARDLPDRQRYSLGRIEDVGFVVDADAHALDSASGAWLAKDDQNMLAIGAFAAGRRGDTSYLKQLGARAAAKAAAAAVPLDRMAWQFVGTTARAYSALVRHDSAQAVELFLTLPDSLAPTSIGPVILDVAKLLTARGRAEEGGALLDRHGPAPLGANGSHVQWHLERARAAAASGDPRRAERLLAYGTAAWLKADPRWKAYVDTVTRAVRRGRQP